MRFGLLAVLAIIAAPARAANVTSLNTYSIAQVSSEESAIYGDAKQNFSKTDDFGSTSCYSSSPGLELSAGVGFDYSIDPPSPAQGIIKLSASATAGTHTLDEPDTEMFAAAFFNTM